MHLLRAIAVVGFTLVADLPVAVALTGIYVLGFVFASVSQFFGPAEGAAIPFVVRRRDLAQANALFTLTVTVSQLVGFATLGPILVGVLGLNRLYLFVALLFLFCATLIWTLPSMTAAPRVRVDGRGPMEALWVDVREAWVYIYRDRLLRKAMGFLTFASAAFLAVGTLAPKFATTVLQLSQSGLGYILAPAGIGMVIGVVLVGHFATPREPGDDDPRRRAQPGHHALALRHRPHRRLPSGRSTRLRPGVAGRLRGDGLRLAARHWAGIHRRAEPDAPAGAERRGSAGARALDLLHALQCVGAGADT